MSGSLDVPRTHIHFMFDTDDGWPHLCRLERDEPGFFSVDVPPEVSLLDALALSDKWSTDGIDSMVTAKAICLQREGSREGSRDGPRAPRVD